MAILGRNSRGGLTWPAAAALAVAAAALSVTGARSQQPAADEQLQRHLASGEFAPALALAHAASDEAIRDHQLSQIAAAQAQTGARAAAVATAGRIASEGARLQSLAQISRGEMAPSGAAGSDGGARGGGVGADFDSLIDLITSTIAPDTWEEVGGTGAVDGFEGGVYVDSAGLMRKIAMASGDKSLASLRAEAAKSDGNADLRKASGLRKVSLPRLERQLQSLRALGREPDEAMDLLAGIHELKYVFVYPESGDVVIAGPAGDWMVDDQGRRVSVATGKPVLRLDDLVVMLRNAYQQGGRFGCSITPRRENLEATQAFLAGSGGKPLSSDREREKWLSAFQTTLGWQDIDIYGVDPRTRTGRVLVEADYHMKQIGMGLEDGVAGVVSYLDALAERPAEEAADFDVLRWWFTLHYEAIAATKSRDGFEFLGPGVKVLSENELLNERGERVHTGKSNELNSEFAHSFTAQFDSLAKKYPVYGELRNIFDLALAAAVMRAEDLPGQADWQMTYLVPDENAMPKAETPFVHEPELGPAPKEVETIINHKIVELRKGKSKRIVTGVSGGVAVDTASLVARDAIRADAPQLISQQRYGAAPEKLPARAWWWD